MFVVGYAIQIWLILAIATSYDTAKQEVVWGHWDIIVSAKGKFKCKEINSYIGELIVLYSKMNQLSPY